MNVATLRSLTIREMANTKGEMKPSQMKKSHREKLVSLLQGLPYGWILSSDESCQRRSGMTLPSCGEITGNPIGPAPEMRNVFAVAEIKDFADEWLPPPPFLLLHSWQTHFWLDEYLSAPESSRWKTRCLKKKKKEVASPEEFIAPM